MEYMILQGVMRNSSLFSYKSLLLVYTISNKYNAEYSIIYLVAYKSNKFDIIFSKYIIGIQGISMLLYIFMFLI